VRAVVIAIGAVRGYHFYGDTRSSVCANLRRTLRVQRAQQRARERLLIDEGEFKATGSRREASARFFVSPCIDIL
jgi:hypothetical protein